MEKAYTARVLVPVDQVRELFEYKPLTGTLHWRTKVSKSTIIGLEVGGFSTSGYRVVRFNGQLHKVHRIVWTWVTGEQPPGVIDHKDGNKTNNCFWNLRAASVAQNNANKQARGWVKRGNRWHARIKFQGCCHYLGAFDTEGEASAAYKQAAFNLHGEFARV